jgi:hypothetical protein
MKISRGNRLQALLTLVLKQVALCFEVFTFAIKGYESLSTEIEAAMD